MHSQLTELSHKYWIENSDSSHDAKVRASVEVYLYTLSRTGTAIRLSRVIENFYAKAYIDKDTKENLIHTHDSGNNLGATYTVSEIIDSVIDWGTGALKSLGIEIIKVDEGTRQDIVNRLIQGKLE